jgi:hypothetical protein
LQSELDKSLRNSMYSESAESPNFLSQIPSFGDFWNPNPFLPDDGLSSFSLPEVELFPQSSTDVRTTPLSPEEQRIFETALRTLDDLSPSRKLIDTLSWLNSSATVNMKLLMEAVNRQLCLDPNALYYLFKDCMPIMAESAIAQVLREGCCPTLARSIINTAQRLSLYVSPETRDALFYAPLSYGNGLEELRVCLTNRASHELDETPSQSDAQRQFRFYAKKIVNKHPPDPWVDDFITLAAAIHLDDGVTLERISDYPFDPQLMGFLTGSWDPEMTSAAELQKIVLNTRQRIHTQYTLAAQPPQSTAAVIAAARPLTSPIIRTTFSDIRTPDELSRAEQMVLSSISRLAAAALGSGTTARLEDSMKIVPRGDVRGEKPLPLWVIKVRPLLPDKVSITLATPLGSGTFKIFWRVCRLAGEPRPHDISMPVYAYGKLKEASKIRSTINDLRQQQLSALVLGNLTIAAALDQKIQQMLTNAARARSQLLNAADIVRQVGDEIAPSPTLAKKTGDPTMVKGIAMACMDGTLTSLETLRMPLKKRLALAITACRLVAQLHDRGFVHLDISCRNILYKKIGTGIELKLSDLDGAKKLTSGYRISRQIGAYPVPETVAATPSHPLTISSSIDNWALGVVVTKIMVGGNKWERLIATRPETSTLAILRDILRPKSRSVSTAALEPLSGLLQPAAPLRWSARAAADAFQAAIEIKISKPADEEALPPKVRRTK